VLQTLEELKLQTTRIVSTFPTTDPIRTVANAEHEGQGRGRRMKVGVANHRLYPMAHRIQSGESRIEQVSGAIELVADDFPSLVGRDAGR